MVIISSLVKYFYNCFLLLIPILIWNIIFIRSLPKGYKFDFFWKDIPVIVGTIENILRIIVMILPLVMLFSLESQRQKIGLILYIIGSAVYFLSWVMLIYYPQNLWAKSMLGFMAPAYTSIFWLTGIGLIGKNTYIKIPNMTVIFICISVVFVIFHTIHSYIIFQRL